MRATFFILLFIFIIKTGLLQAQMKLSQNFYSEPVKYSHAIKKHYQFHVGLGLGMDYGGLGGIRFSYLPLKQLAVFAAGGYALIGLGYNVGAFYRPFTEKKACPYVGAMYGYNAVLVVEGASKYDKIYYGPSFTLGLEIRSSKLKNYFNAELLLPIRSDSYENDLKTLKNDPLIKMSSEPTPIGFSLGYHFVF